MFQTLIISQIKKKIFFYFYFLNLLLLLLFLLFFTVHYECFPTSFHSGSGERSKRLLFQVFQCLQLKAVQNITIKFAK